tara:strand:- start:330 stop:779 length:450 start_codon:yes stop_codon:yes gene_type:complete
MKHLEQNIDFELLINKTKKNRYKATTPLFPQCKGFGDTDNEAIEKLCNSISKFIQKKTHTYLQQNLLTKDYSKIITDLNQTDSFQHRVINLSAQVGTPIKKVYIKSFGDILGNTTTEQEFEPSSFNETFMNNTPPKNDDSILGISVCLN